MLCLFFFCCQCRDFDCGFRRRCSAPLALSSLPPPLQAPRPRPLPRRRGRASVGAAAPAAPPPPWVTRQNDVTFAHLNQIAFRDAIRKKLETANNFEKVSLPFKHGDYTYFYKNDGIQNQAVLYRQKENDQKELGEAQIFLDPNTFSEEGTTSLDSVSFSKSDTVIAYSVSEGGSDWRTIYVIDAETGEELEAPILNAKFTGISWFGDEGFYYASSAKPAGSELSARTEHHNVYFHRSNQPHSEAVLVLGGSE